MPRYVASLILLSAVVYILVSVVIRVRSGRYKLLLFEIAGVVVLLLIVHALFNLLEPVVSFGPPRHVMILLSYVFLLLGMAAQYLFDHWGKPEGSAQFKLTSFLQPFLISPIVFLPLLGLIPETSHGPIGEREFFVWINAFQNGFFWRVVYDKVQRQMAG